MRPLAALLAASLLAACPGARAPEPAAPSPPAAKTGAAKTGAATRLSAVEAVSLPRALGGWVKTVLVLQPRAGQRDREAAAALETARVTAAQRLHSAGIRARVAAAGPLLAVGLERTAGTALVKVTQVLGLEAPLAFYLIDDRTSFFGQLGATLRAGDGIEAGRQSYTFQGRLITHTELWSDEPERLRLLLATLPPALRPPRGRRVLLGPQAHPRTHRPGFVCYLVEEPPAIAGSDVEDAREILDPGASVDVAVTFAAPAARRLEQVTATGIGRRLAIVVGDLVESAPLIQSRVGGGRARISLGSAGTALEQRRAARTLTESLRAGALRSPLRLATIEQLP